MATCSKINHTELRSRADALIQLSRYASIMPDEAQNRLNNLRMLCDMFAAGGLAELRLSLCYESGSTPTESWHCVVNLPNSAVTRQNLLAKIRTTVERYRTGINEEENVITFFIHDDVKYSAPKIVRAINTNIRIQNQARPSARKNLTARDFKGLLDAVRDMLAQAAKGRLWQDDSRYYRRSYTPQKHVYRRRAENVLNAQDNYDSDFDSNQMLIEDIEGVDTVFVVRTQPFNISITEDVTVSRHRKRRFILENTDA